MNVSIDTDIGGGSYWHPEYDPYDPITFEMAHEKTPDILKNIVQKNDALEVLVDLGYKVSDARNQINEVINGLENKDEVKAENLLKEVFKRSR